MKNRGISIIIPTHNVGPGFAEVLARLRRQQVDRPLEMIVLDSQSTDGTAALARQAGARVEMIEPARFNHGATRNRGIELSSGEIIVMHSGDALPVDDFLLSRLCGNFADPPVAGAYARQVPRPDHPLLVQRHVREWCGSMVRRENIIADRSRYDCLPPLERLAICRFSNVCSAIRRAAWEQMPFAACEFAEDLDWSKRVLEAGWKIIYDPAACVIHSHSLPLFTQYRRYYQGHRAMRQLFGLQLIPARRELLRQWYSQTAQGIKWSWQNEPGITRKFRSAGTVPLRILATVLGTYRGARSAAPPPSKPRPEDAANDDGPAPHRRPVSAAASRRISP